MKIPPHFSQELKNALNIVDVAGEYLRLVKKGKNHFGLCPFHREKSPSFSVNEQLQIFHCFGCGKSGDVISLVMELDHMTYGEAVRHLAEKTHIRIPEADPEADARHRGRKFLGTVMSEAIAFYRSCLASAAGEKARAYLDGRGVSQGTVETFRLGFAPDGGFHLSNHLKGKGVAEQHLLDAGLAKRSEKSGRIYDAFRDRLMIPILDRRGEPVAFGGRLMGEGEPKYLNSPETSIYHKGKHLFGLFAAQDEIRETDSAVLVEGYFDMIVPFQAGVRRVTASLGTSLTSDQVQILGRYTRNVVVCFDPDSAGSSAAYRSVELFLESDFDCRVAVLPEGADPDVFVRERGADAFRDLLARAVPFMEFVWGKGLEKFRGEPSIKQKSKLMETLFPFIAKVLGQVERSRYLTELSGRLELDEKAVFRQFNQFSGTRRVDAQALVSPGTSETLAAERELVAFLHSFPELAPPIFTDTFVTFEGLATSKILAGVRDMVNAEGRLDWKQLDGRLSDEDRVVIQHILLKTSRLIEDPEEARGCLLTLHRKALERLRSGVLRKLREAEQRGDSDACLALFQENKALEREIHRLP